MNDNWVTDQLGRKILVPSQPLRIISLVPSQTELLFDLGLDHEIIGITKFCTHPAGKVRPKNKIGGTKTLDLEKIAHLRPDLIIGNKEENERSQIEALEKDFPVWMSDIYELKDALNMITQVGTLVGKQENAVKISETIRSAFERLCPSAGPAPRIVYFIWKNPYMVAGRTTFIDHIITCAGWENAVNTERYPELSAANLGETDADVILLSSEPYPFQEKHRKEFQELYPGKPVIIVDGELFSWYGSRLQHTAAYLSRLQKQIFTSGG